MSIDVQVAHACPHHIRYELVSVLGEREIISISPISGMGLISLTSDGVEIPPEGLRAEGLIIFPKSAPYVVRAGQDTINISTSDGQQKTVTLSSKIYSQGEMVNALKGKLPEGMSVSAKGKNVSLSGNGYFDSISLSGSGLKPLGFKSPKVVVKAKVLFPSWKLVKIAGSTGYKIQLSKNVSTESVLKLSYTTQKSYCRRCQGTGVENDIRFNDEGGVQMIGGYDLLYQRIAKALLTVRGSNPYHSFYGSTALSLIGQKVVSGARISLEDSVRDALDRLISIDRQQAAAQDMTPEERLLRVRSVSVSTIGNDETSFLVRVEVDSFSSRKVDVNVVFAVPGSIPLDGDLA